MLRDVTCSLVGPRQSRAAFNGKCTAAPHPTLRQVLVELEFTDAETDERFRFTNYLTLQQAEQLIDTINEARRSLVSQLLNANGVTP